MAKPHNRRNHHNHTHSTNDPRNHKGNQMAKRLNQEQVQLVEQEIKNFIYHSDECKRLEVLSAQWFIHKRQRDAIFNILQSMTGLSTKRLDDLIAGRTNTATYWLTNGQIRKDH